MRTADELRARRARSCEIEVRDADGRGARPGRGRARSGSSGPNLIRGYWNRPEATAETIVDGWLRSGDIGRIDDEGFVYVEDRAKDMVLRAGENVYCAEVEAAIYEHPAVYEAAVFGVPHERLGEEVAARDRAEARERARPPTTLPRTSRSTSRRSRSRRSIELRDEPLPRNPAGKILKRAAARRARGRRRRLNRPPALKAPPRSAE